MTPHASLREKCPRLKAPLCLVTYESQRKKELSTVYPQITQIAQKRAGRTWLNSGDRHQWSASSGRCVLLVRLNLWNLRNLRIEAELCDTLFGDFKRCPTFVSANVCDCEITLTLGSVLVDGRTFGSHRYKI